MKVKITAFIPAYGLSYATEAKADNESELESVIQTFKKIAMETDGVLMLHTDEYGEVVITPEMRKQTILMMKVEN